jgi:lipoprotein NlpI
LIEARAERELMRRNAVTEAEQWGWSAATRQLHQFYRQVLMQRSLPMAA